MIAGLSKTLDALIETMKDSEQEKKKLKAKMNPEQLKFINAFEAEIKEATKSNDLSKISKITKKYFSQHGNTK
jgi:hypothetical protein